MAYLDGVLLGFVVGLGAGIFLAYKIAQRSKGKPSFNPRDYDGDVGGGYPIESEQRKRLR